MMAAWVWVAGVVFGVMATLWRGLLSLRIRVEELGLLSYVGLALLGLAGTMHVRLRAGGLAFASSGLLSFETKPMRLSWQETADDCRSFSLHSVRSKRNHAKNTVVMNTE